MQAHELPPPAQMVLLLGGFRISQALYAAAALGVADHLVAGPAPADVLAGRTGAQAPSLHRLLRTLASVGVFTEPEPGVFALTPLGQTLTCRLQEVRPQAPFALAALTAHVIARTALAALGFSRASFHEAFHADGTQ
jgi:hypothetical protein